MSDQDKFKLAVCSLLAEGKKPSVAHLKAKLGSGTPLPAIINLLQQYQAAPEMFSASDATSKKAPAQQEAKQPVTSASSSTPPQDVELSDIHNELVQIRQLLEQLVKR